MPARVSQQEWDRRAAAEDLRWLEPVNGSRERIAVECKKCDHRFSLIATNVRTGCPICNGNAKFGKVLDQEEADRRFRKAGFEPLELYVGKDAIRLCECTTCHRQFGVRYSHVRRGGGCAYCSGKRVDLDDVERVFREAGLTPLAPYVKNTKPRLCRCIHCDRDTSPTFSNLKKGIGGCKYCAGRAVKTDEVDAAFRQSGMDPLDAYTGADSPRRCRCLKCGNVVSPSWSSVRAGKGCIYCAKRRVTIEQVDAVFATAGIKPLEPYVNAKTPRRSQCLKCYAEVAPLYDNLKQGQGGCPTCGEYGFNPELPSMLYLLRYQNEAILKVGIAKRADLAQGQPRLRQHIGHGWKTLKVWDFETGFQAREIETKVLAWWRDDLGLPPAHTEGSGWTETVSGDQLTPRQVTTFIEKAIKNGEMNDRN